MVDDGTARIWNLYDGKDLIVFKHEEGVTGVDFSPNGKFLLSSGDATARLWEVQTGKEVRHFIGHTNEVRNATFSPDGKYILTAGSDGTARLWLTDLNDTIHAVCALLTHDLTAEERIQFDISEQEPTCPAQ